MKKKFIVLAALFVVAALIFWFFYPLRSYAVMGVYSGQHSRESLMKQQGFTVNIPAGQGWYPFMLTYNAEGFASWAGLDADMTVIYNFGAFDLSTRTSSVYDPESDKYCAFYGAYVLRKNGGVFGFTDDGKPDMDEVTLAVKYDDTVLVLEGFGCDSPVFKVDSFDIARGVSYAGSGDWARIDAAITASGVAHNNKESKTAYLQYGPPTQSAEADFAVTALRGRLYLKYFEEYDSTVMIYVIARDAAVVEQCDTELLQKTKISALQQ